MGDERDDRGWKPRSASQACHSIVFRVGEANRVGSDDFSVLVGTPEGILEYQRSTGADAPAALRRMLVVAQWDRPKIETALRNIVAAGDDVSWPQAAERLQRHFGYEYEDYNIAVQTLPVLPMVKSIQSTEHHLSSWTPMDGECAYAQLKIRIGVAKQKDDLVVKLVGASPVALRTQASDFVLSDVPLFLFEEFSLEALSACLGETMKWCRGVDWPDSRERILRYFRSE